MPQLCPGKPFPKQGFFWQLFQAGKKSCVGPRSGSNRLPTGPTIERRAGARTRTPMWSASCSPSRVTRSSQSRTPRRAPRSECGSQCERDSTSLRKGLGRDLGRRHHSGHRPTGQPGADLGSRQAAQHRVRQDRTGDRRVLRNRRGDGPQAGRRGSDGAGRRPVGGKTRRRGGGDQRRRRSSRCLPDRPKRRGRRQRADEAGDREPRPARHRGEQRRQVIAPLAA